MTFRAVSLGLGEVVGASGGKDAKDIEGYGRLGALEAALPLVEVLLAGGDVRGTGSA